MTLKRSTGVTGVRDVIGEEAFIEGGNGGISGENESDDDKYDKKSC